MQELMQKMNFEIYEKLKKALALGKWEDGKRLDSKQKENTMQLILMFELEKEIPLDKRVGHIEAGCSNPHQNEANTDQVLQFKSADKPLI